MPHVVIKMHSGRSEAQKQQLSDEVTRALMNVLGSKEASISVAIEDVEPARWMADVYEPEIAGKKHTLYKQPGY